jgi:hypothetical protein
MPRGQPARSTKVCPPHLVYQIALRNNRRLLVLYAPSLSLLKIKRVLWVTSEGRVGAERDGPSSGRGAFAFIDLPACSGEMLEGRRVPLQYPQPPTHRLEVDTLGCKRIKESPIERGVREAAGS